MRHAPHSNPQRILVDTSVWIEHGKKHDPILAELIDRDRVVLHWTVVGELAVGNIRNRESFLRDLSFFDCLRDFSAEKILKTIENEKLFGKGLSLVDCLLLVAAKEHSLTIYSHDKKLNTFRPE